MRDRIHSYSIINNSTITSVLWEVAESMITLQALRAGDQLSLDEMANSTSHPDPNHLTIRRLTKIEYKNSWKLPSSCHSSEIYMIQMIGMKWECVNKVFNFLKLIKFIVRLHCAILLELKLVHTKNNSYKDNCNDYIRMTLIMTIWLY